MRYVVGVCFALVALAGCTGGRGPSNPGNQGVQVGNGMQAKTQANFRSAHGFAVQFDSSLTISEMPGRKTIRIDDNKANPSRVSSVELTYLDNLGIDNEQELTHMTARRHPGINFRTVHTSELIEKIAELAQGDQVVQIRYLLARTSKRTIGAEMKATKATAGMFAQILESLQVDTNPPDVKAVYWTSDFQAGYPAEVRIAAEESISGVKRIRAVFHRATNAPWRATEKFVLEGDAQALDKAGEYRIVDALSPHIVSGRYKLVEFRVTDGASNEATFDWKKNGAELSVFVNGSATEDRNRPEILEVRMPDNIRVGSLNQIFFRARDQESGIFTGKDVPVHIALTSASGSDQVEIRSATIVPTSRPEEYRMEFDISRWVRSGVYSLDHFLIRDLAGNTNEMTLKDDRYVTYVIDGMTHKEMETARGVGAALGAALTGYPLSQAYPRIAGATFKQRRYRPGETVRLEVTTTKPLSEEVRAVLKLTSRGKDDVSLVKPTRVLQVHREGERRYFIEFIINPWANLGFYHLEGLELQAGPTFRAITLDGVTWDDEGAAGNGSPPSREPRFQQPGFTVE